MTPPLTAAAAVASLLDDLAFGFAVLNDRRRPGAYRNAARVIKKLGADLPRALSSGELLAMKGIGKSIVATVEAALQGRQSEVLERLGQDLPLGLLAARKVRGLGPGRVRAVWQTLGCQTLGEIEYACIENRLVELPGFSAATQAAVLTALADLRDRAGKMRVDQAWAVANKAMLALRLAGALRVQVVGALTRAEEVVTEVELAVLAGDATLPPVDDVVVHLAPNEDVFGSTVAWHIAAPGHRELVCKKAEEMGFSWTSHGLKKGDVPIATPQDHHVYDALDLHPPAYERREADVPLRTTDEAPERLVARTDILGLLHNHTTESDGLHDLEQMQQAAQQLGLQYLGISDHSQTASYAGGLQPQRLRQQAAVIARMNIERPGCTLLTGVESDILRDGSLDYSDAELARLDVVIASVHNSFGQGPDKLTERIVTAARDRHGDVLGHPTGRLLLGRAPMAFDMEAVLDACAESGMAVELNSNPHRLDLKVEHLQMAKQRGLKVSIAADAHSTHGLAHVEHGVRQARRAGLAPDDVLNAMPAAALKAWVQDRRR